jgi:hypothetical protein
MATRLLRRLAVVSVAVGLFAQASLRAGGEDARPLPDPPTFLAAVRANLQRSQGEQSRFAYKERRTELNTNPFGRLGTGDIIVYDFVPNADGTMVTRRLVERNGKATSGEEAEPQQRARNPRPQPRRNLEDIADALNFTVDRREIVNGRPFILVNFAARPNAKPQTREGKIVRAFTGTIWVDEDAREIERMEGVAVDDLSLGFGLVARLNEGTKVYVKREPFRDGLWVPTTVRFTGEGRAMLFRKLSLNFVIDWFDYRDVSRATQ